VTCTLPASPEAVYDAWLDSGRHGEMTGAKASIGERVGDRYSAWDGYITGKTLELVPARRTADFDEIRPRFNDRGGPRTDEERNAAHPDSQRRARQPHIIRERRLANFYFSPMKAYFARAPQRPKPAKKSA
jgi:hypothetical protein